MPKVAIVGPSEEKWTSKQKSKAESEIYKIFFKNLKGYHYEEESYGGFIGLKTQFDFNDLTLISGACPKGGVDIWAEEIADINHIKKQIFNPEVNQWNDKVECNGKEFTSNHIHKVLMGYKSRNIKIAEACDVLYCVVPHNRIGLNLTPYNPICYCKHCDVWGHPTNGGCWTMKYAKKLGKETHLIVIE